MARISVITYKQGNIFIQCKKVSNSAIYEQNCENVCSKIKKKHPISWKQEKKQVFVQES